MATVCKGLAMRLLSHSAAFMDMQDSDNGISRRRMVERFQTIFEDNHSIDEQELLRYVDFVFEGMQSDGLSGEHVQVHQFCDACGGEEKIPFDLVCQLFDSDRKTTLFEMCF